jgi:hypothetical protein
VDKDLFFAVAALKAFTEAKGHCDANNKEKEWKYQVGCRAAMPLGM